MAKLADNLESQKLLWVTLGEAAVPPNGLIQHFKDYHWIYHPDRGILYWGNHRHWAPQCNQERSIAESVCEKLWAHLGCRTIFMPSVFRKINPGDYC